MEAQVLLYIIIFLLLLDFISGRYMSLLNLRHARKGIPDILKPYFDEKHQGKILDYSQAKSRLGFIASLVSTLLILIVLLFGYLGDLDAFISSYVAHPILQALLFFLVLGILSDILSTPFSAYSTFVIEEKFGFNKMTVKTFVLDKLKSWIIAGILGGGVISLMILIWNWLGFWFWIPAWVLVSLISIFMVVFYSTLIAPLFNKYEPLKKGDLRQRIIEFSDEAGFELDNIFVMDGSKRSTKANAYFTGLGKRKRIVLYDTLIENHCPEEIVAVLAHEIGHYQHKHILKGMAISILFTGFMLLLLAAALQFSVFSEAMGGVQQKFHLGLISFGFLYSPTSFLSGLLSNKISRKHEYQADAFATSHGLGEELTEALIRLHKDSLSPLNPHPAYVRLHYSHPPLWQRLSAIKAAAR